jgi:hypothetical protein
MNEIRARAEWFAGRMEERLLERGETQAFYKEFFEVLGVTRCRVASFVAQRRGNERASSIATIGDFVSQYQVSSNLAP